MEIKIDIHKDEKLKDAPSPILKQIESTLAIRRTLSGDYQILDHGDMDIIVKTDQAKIVTFAKSDPDGEFAVIDADLTYEAQKRLFNFLTKKGIIEFDSVEGGAYYTSMEATFMQPKEDGLNPLHAVLFVISKFIEKEKPYYMFRKSHEEQMMDYYFEPDDENSTDLGDVEQAVKKGSIDTGYFPTGANYRVYESIDRGDE